MIINTMYDVELTSSNYNPDMGTTITITATLKDFNGNAVVGKSVTIKHNGTNLSTVTTNSNGQASVSTTCGSGGTHNFTYKSSCCTVSVNPYPVNSIYMSVNSTNPATLFGGTWTQLKDRFLLGAGDTYPNGSTDGEATHTLSEAELPKISGAWGLHGQESGTEIFSHSGYATGQQKSGQYRSPGSIVNSAYSQQNPGFSFGQGQAHNNMPPYLTVYIWKRTA